MATVGRVACYFPEDSIADLLNCFCMWMGLPFQYYFNGRVIERWYTWIALDAPEV